jgi:isopentenyl-diphosphate delta-isomerase type 1
LCDVSAPQEFFDVVDHRDRVIGRAARDEVHARKLKHRAVHVLLFNERGELFVQKRAAGKDTFPGCYDSSAAGHLNSGETYDGCAVRELREELGLKVSADRLDKIFKAAACEQTGWEFVWVYRLQGKFQPVVNPAEIEAGQFWPVDRVEALVTQRPETCAPSFALIVREFRGRGLWPVASRAGRGKRCKAGVLPVYRKRRRGRLRSKRIVNR